MNSDDEGEESSGSGSAVTVILLDDRGSGVKCISNPTPGFVVKLRDVFSGESALRRFAGSFRLMDLLGWLFAEKH